MSTVKSTIIATAAFGMIASFGMLGQPSSSSAMEGEKGAANTPENIQRSAPSGNKFPGSGTGPGSRTDQLTGSDEGQSSMSAQSSSGTKNTPSNIQRSAPSGNEFPGSGTGPGSRTDQLTEMGEAEVKKNPTDPDKLMKD